MDENQTNTAFANEQLRRRSLITAVKQRNPREAAKLLAEEMPNVAGQVLLELNPGQVTDILELLSEDLVGRVLSTVPTESARQWARNQAYPEGCVGRMMDPAIAVFPPHITVGQTIERLRGLIKSAFVTYGFVTDEAGRLLGLITMRDLLFAAHERTLADVMLKDPFCLGAETRLSDAMKSVLNRHYPVYPVCDDHGRLVGLVRGQVMFEEQTLEISAQAGTMVGVEEERLTTPWPRSLKLRHPWLQVNLLTAFLAAAVVGVFQETLDKLVILALFLPVLAGQSGNTGCQALAVTLRGLTLGEVRPGRERILVIKEASLGLLNGALVGLVAAGGMYYVASAQHNPAALMLSVAVLLAMIGSCVVSGVSGAMIPLTLKRLGADPATASSIFLTTATDVASMGLFLGLATLLVLA
ncbi:MAG TPA: magnesium transporter [Burkholderiales bacterium]|jgi:magnesium transporter|nr:magnesium transporter [Burkholderiales bacterium]